MIPALPLALGLALVAPAAIPAPAADPPAAGEPAPAADPADPAGAAAPAPAEPPPPPQATPLSVRPRLSAASVKLGEPFRLELEIRHRRGERYALPASLPGPPFRAGAHGCRDAVVDGAATTTCTIELALLELGPHELPTLRLPVETPEGPRVLDVPGARIEGIGIIDPAVPASDLRLRPQAPPVPLLVRSLRLLWWGLAVAAGAAAFALAIRALRRRRRRAVEPPPPIPPDVRFAGRLDRLEAERLAERGRALEHVVQLSEAVREYLGAVAGLPALDLTTAELLAALGAAGDPRLDLAALRAFSEGADLVKFARLPADPAGCAAGLAFGRELLARTRAPLPTPAPPPGTGAPAAPDGPPAGPAGGAA